MIDAESYTKIGAIDKLGANMMHVAVAERLYSYSDDITSEINFDTNNVYLCRLDYLNCVSVIGDNANDFLQGQLSCNVNQVDNDHYQTGLLCSLKGRIIAMMDVIHCHDYQLVMEKDITDKTLSVLQKAAMISRVQLKPSDKYSVLGIVGNLNNFDLPIAPPKNSCNLSQNETACLYRVSTDMSILLVKNDIAENLIGKYSNQVRGSVLWHYLSLKNNRPSIYPSTQGQFLPHRLDLHLQPGFISLDKGCFRGQEIIARTHYRAKLKHHYCTYITDQKPVLGSPVMLDAIEVGEIIDYCPISDRQYLISASVKKEYIDNLQNR